MALKNISINVGDVIPSTQNTQLTLASMYLEETLSEGLCIEIPSLGISLCRERTPEPEHEDYLINR